MSFKDEFPDHKNYEEDDYYYSRVPPQLNGAICGLIGHHSQSSGTLKNVCYKLSGLIPCEPTQNWGRDFLLNDLNDLLRQLSLKRFDKYMDFLTWLATDLSDSVGIEDLNEVLQEHSLGYLLASEHGSVYWQLRSGTTFKLQPLIEAKKEIVNVCHQAADHLRKALEHLQNSDDQRSRKDALRDALSAMESVVKKLTGEEKFEDGIKFLRANSWGPDIIIKDGLGVWDRIHQLYPDVRHGSPTVTALSPSEAFYWIERIINYLSYLQRRQREMCYQIN